MRTAWILLIVFNLSGCANSRFRQDGCSYGYPSRSTYAIKETGERGDEVVQIQGVFTDIDSEEAISAAALKVSLANLPDSFVAGADVDSLGQFRLELNPGTFDFHVNALSYVGLVAENITLSPGSIWSLQFKLHRQCPIVE